MKYTARDGGDRLRDTATAVIKTQLNPQSSSSVELLRFPVALSCRSDFPTEWARARAGSDLKIQISQNLLPYWMVAAKPKLSVVEVSFADLRKGTTKPEIKLRWPPRNGVADTWPLAALDQNGYGEAHFGLLDRVEDTVIDRIILLSIGVRPN